MSISAALSVVARTCVTFSSLRRSTAVMWCRKVPQYIFWRRSAHANVRKNRADSPALLPFFLQASLLYVCRCNSHRMQTQDQSYRWRVLTPLHFPFSPHVHRMCMASKYPAKAQKKVEKAMHEYKRGTLKSGRSGKRVQSRKQAIAIGLSEARRAGADVPSGRQHSITKRH